MSDRTIHFMITGGTIDSVCHDRGRSNRVSGIERYIRESIKPWFEFPVDAIMMKDSRDLTDQDREVMVSAIEKSPHRRIVLTHGTYTMTDTASFISSSRTRFPQKTVVLTGAMIPQADEGSDAPFNLGFAVHAALTLDAGVFLAMNGRIWEPGTVRKDLDAARFVPAK